MKNYISFVNYVYLDFVSAWIIAMIIILLGLLQDNLVYIIINVGNGGIGLIYTNAPLYLSITLNMWCLDFYCDYVQ